MRSRWRLMVVTVAVFSLLVALVGKLWQLQVLAEERFDRAAADVSTQRVIRPPLAERSTTRRDGRWPPTRPA